MTAITRVVFDCNTLLQALASPDGPAGRCVQLAIDEKVSLFTSPFVFDELREITSRSRVIVKLQLIGGRVDQFLDMLEIVTTVLDGFPEVFSYQRDPADAHYINLAFAANAKLIISRDKDLLDLMDPSKPEAADFENNIQPCG